MQWNAPTSGDLHGGSGCLAVDTPTSRGLELTLAFSAELPDTSREIGLYSVLRAGPAGEALRAAVAWRDVKVTFLSRLLQEIPIT